MSSSPACPCPARRPSTCGGTALWTKSGMPPGDMRDLLVVDVDDLVSAFAGIARSDLVDVRLERVSHDSCWKFHRDFVEARLLTTYRGPGTEWVQPTHAERALRAQRRFKGPLEQISGNDVALFKGNRGGPGSGIVHRSPPIAGTGCTRLLLALNKPSTASPEPWPRGVEHEMPPETGFIDRRIVSRRPFYSFSDSVRCPSFTRRRASSRSSRRRRNGVSLSQSPISAPVLPQPRHHPVFGSRRQTSMHGDLRALCPPFHGRTSIGVPGSRS